jgi:flagella basal body P-ring formation protein FlgA
MRRLGVFAAALALAAAPAMALAGPPAELRQDVAVAGGKVTLGDLFYDAGAAAGIVVARAAPGQMVVLDATQVQIIARSNGVDWGNPTGVRRIIVQSSAPAPTPAPETSRAAAAEARKPARGPAVLAYMHNLNAGDIVRAEDLTWSRDAVAGGDAPRDPDAVIGMAVRRPLREGDTVSLRDLSAPIVIKRDEMVAVTFSLAGLSVTLDAKAMADAAAGQPVSVMNLSSKKVIQAVAVAAGHAVVGPEADQLKASARLAGASSLSNPSRLALR